MGGEHLTEAKKAFDPVHGQMRIFMHWVHWTFALLALWSAADWSEKGVKKDCVDS